jgi:adenine deaminase
LLAPDDFVLKTDREGETQVHVLKVFREQIISVEESETLTVKDGAILPDPTKDILKMAVVERHGKTAPNIARGFVRGFGLREGAIASSISPDIHQIVVVGIDNADMARAVNRLVELQGGIVICRNGEVVGELCLPVAGLMSQEPYEKAIADLERLSNVAREIGCDLPSPFMTLAFSACPTLTEFKLSDRGLIDICAGQLVALELE